MWNTDERNIHIKKIITTVLMRRIAGGWAASADVYYQNCTAAWDAGAAPLHEGDEGYEAPRLDRDQDGIARNNPHRTPVD